MSLSCVFIGILAILVLMVSGLSNTASAEDSLNVRIGKDEHAIIYDGVKIEQIILKPESRSIVITTADVIRENVTLKMPIALVNKVFSGPLCMLDLQDVGGYYFTAYGKGKTDRIR